eukprot:5539655-Pyramimonas_sp.AAC.1
MTQGSLAKVNRRESVDSCTNLQRPFFRVALLFDSCLLLSLDFGSPRQAGRWSRGFTSDLYIKRGAWWGLEARKRPIIEKSDQVCSNISDGAAQYQDPKFPLREAYEIAQTTGKNVVIPPGGFSGGPAGQRTLGSQTAL